MVSLWNSQLERRGGGRGGWGTIYKRQSVQTVGVTKRINKGKAGLYILTMILQDSDKSRVTISRSNIIHTVIQHYKLSKIMDAAL